MYYMLLYVCFSQDFPYSFAFFLSFRVVFSVNVFCWVANPSRGFFFNRQVLEESNEASEDALAAAQAVDGLMSEAGETLWGWWQPEIR